MFIAMGRNSTVLCVWLAFSIANLVVISSFRIAGLKKNIRRYSTRDIRMDDEVSRSGIKEELTTRDEYLDARFRGLSPSGHDLTPMTSEEIERWKETHHDYGLKWDGSRRPTGCEIGLDLSPFLGMGDRGLYVAAIGGLPVFASGARIDKLCDGKYLYFTEPCDEVHINVERGSDSKPIRCIRSNTLLGSKVQIKDKNGNNTDAYEINVQAVRFLPLRMPWPPESQPENFWGTEGQYRAWNEHDLSKRPLSY
jgi:heme exporter protein D